MKKLINSQDSKRLKERMVPGLTSSSQKVACFCRELKHCKKTNKVLDVATIITTSKGKEIVGGDIEILRAVIKTGIDCKVSFVDQPKDQFLETQKTGKTIDRALAMAGVSNAKKIRLVLTGVLRVDNSGVASQLNLEEVKVLDSREILEHYNDPRYKDAFDKAIEYEEKVESEYTKLTQKKFYANMGRLNVQRVLVDFFCKIHLSGYTDKQLDKRVKRYVSGDINQYLIDQALLVSVPDSGPELLQRLLIQYV